MIRNLFVVTKDNFGIFITMLVIVSFSYVSFYYSLYGFDITPYLSPAEIISMTLISVGKLNFSKILVYFIVVTAIVLIGGVLKTLMSLDKEIAFERRAAFTLTLYYNLFFIGMVINEAVRPLNPLKYFLNLDYRYPEGFLGFIVLGIILIGVVNLLKFVEAPEWILYNLARWELCFILIMTHSLITEARAERDSVVKGKYQGSRILTNNGEIISDSLNAYIGRTASAVFIYCRGNGEIRVIPSSEIKQIVICSTTAD